MGVLVLQGGSEFKGAMKASDEIALALAGGREAKVVVIPTAAVPNNDSEGAGYNACTWFRSLGAKNIIALPITDKKSADDPELADHLKQAGLIYILGGSPGYLDDTLKGSRCFDALWNAYQQGAVLAGSSAGAMILCEWYFDPATKNIKKGFGIQKNVILIPHHDIFGDLWHKVINDKLSNISRIGIDEQTGMINRGGDNQWAVYGQGGVTLYDQAGTHFYQSGQTFRL